MSADLSSIVRDALLVAVSEIPVAGSLVNYFERRKGEHDSESTRRVFDGLARELIRLKGRLVEAIVRSSELERRLSEVSTQVAIIARRSHNPAKLEASARLMANTLLRDGDAESIVHAERQLFLNALESLSDAAITLIVKAHRSLSHQDKLKLETDLVRADFSDLKRSLPLEGPLLMGVVGELDRFNLLHKIGSPGVRIGLYDNYPIYITPLAARFVRFVQFDKSSSASV